MSRHRNVRSMNVDDEYYDDDDMYGHSVDDNYCISPSTAAEFTYHRGNNADLSSYLAAERISEESGSDQESLSQPSPRKKRQLSDLDTAKLSSCIDEVHNVLGDTVKENHLTDVILRHQFNINAVLDELLSTNEISNAASGTRKATSQNQGPKTQVVQAGGVTKPGHANKHQKSKTQLERKDETVSTMCNGVAAVTIVAQSKPVKGFTVKEDKTKVEHAIPAETSADKDMAIVRELVGAPTSFATPIKSGDPTKNISPAPKPTPSKAHAMTMEKMKEEYAKRLDGKDLINLVVIGHVDAGKSTLMGHLLYQIGNVNKRAMHKYEQESQKAGKSSFMYAWVLDETAEERTRGVTMDVAQRSFETDHKIVTLLDAPGHKDFIPNMITGAAQADTAVLVVNATKGEFETGFEAGGQTREHSLLARSLGVSQLIVAVNKMDTVNWEKTRYDEIIQKIRQFLRQIGYKDSDISFVPCSGLSGENLCHKTQIADLLSWYSGPTLLQLIDNLRRVERAIDKPLRFSVSDIFKGLTSGFVVAGKVESGVTQVGDKVLVMPAGETATIKGITIDELSTFCSFAGDHATLALTGIDPNNISIGCILCDISVPIVSTTRFRARIVVFNITVPITKGFPVVLHYQSMSEPAVIKCLVCQLSKSTGQVTKNRPKCLVKNSNAVIEIGVARPVCLEAYRDFKDLGRFMLRSNGVTIAAGLVEQVTVDKPS